MAHPRVRRTLLEASGWRPYRCERARGQPAAGCHRAIRCSTLEAIRRELDCQPGDLLAYEAD